MPTSSSKLFGYEKIFQNSIYSTSVFIPSISVHLCAQPNCQIQYFSVYNGMAQKTVTGIVQDPKGFIWFSTWNGLNKFDGYTFKNYKAYPGDGCTLTSNRLYSITQNQHCDIWCHTYDERVYLFDSRNEKFIDILHPIEEKNKTRYNVNKIYALPKGISWIVCDNEAFRIDEHAFKEDNETIKSITLYSEAAGNLPGNAISNIYQDSDGDEWIFTNKGIRVIGKKTIESVVNFKSTCENNGKMYLLSKDNRLAIYSFQTKQLRFKKIPYSYSRLNNIQNLGKDSIGIGSDNGIIFFLNKKTNSATQISVLPLNHLLMREAYLKTATMSYGYFLILLELHATIRQPAKNNIIRHYRKTCQRLSVKAVTLFLKTSKERYGWYPIWDA